MKSTFSMRSVMVTAFMGLALTLGATTCGEADRTFDCQSVCDKYQDCFDSNYDVGACRSRCRDRARNDADYERKADVCEACISGQSCAAATFSCSTECAGFDL